MRNGNGQTRLKIAVRSHVLSYPSHCLPSVTFSELSRQNGYRTLRDVISNWLFFSLLPYFVLRIIKCFFYEQFVYINCTKLAMVVDFYDSIVDPIIFACLPRVYASSLSVAAILNWAVRCCIVIYDCNIRAKLVTI